MSSPIPPPPRRYRVIHIQGITAIELLNTANSNIVIIPEWTPPAAPATATAPVIIPNDLVPYIIILHDSSPSGQAAAGKNPTALGATASLNGGFLYFNLLAMRKVDLADPHVPLYAHPSGVAVHSKRYARFRQIFTNAFSLLSPFRAPPPTDVPHYYSSSLFYHDEYPNTGSNGSAVGHYGMTVGTTPNSTHLLAMHLSSSNEPQRGEFITRQIEVVPPGQGTLSTLQTHAAIPSKSKDSQKGIRTRSFLKMFALQCVEVDGRVTHMVKNQRIQLQDVATWTRFLGMMWTLYFPQDQITNIASPGQSIIGNKSVWGAGVAKATPATKSVDQ